MLHNIFQRIAINKAIHICELLEDGLYPQDLLSDYMCGYYGENSRSSSAKYWLLCQKLALMSILKLHTFGLLNAHDVVTDFWYDRLEAADYTPEDDEEGVSILESFWGAESQPDIGQGLRNTDMTYMDLFKQIGFDILEYMVHIPSQASPTFLEELILDSKESKDFIIRKEDNTRFVEWLETVDIFCDSCYWIWSFETKDSYSPAEIEHIFEGCIRLDNVFFSTAVESGARVYVLAPASSKDYFDFDDYVDLSSLDPRTFLTALYYHGCRRPGLPDFQNCIV